MSESDKDAKSDAPKGKILSLKRTVESGQVRQSFSHGRSKSVVVEKRRKKVLNIGSKNESVSRAPARPSPPARAREEVSQKPPPKTDTPALGGLSKSERDARAAAVTQARQRAKDEEIEAARKAELEALGLGDMGGDALAEATASATPEPAASVDEAGAIMPPDDALARKAPASDKKDAKKETKKDQPRKTALTRRGEPRRRSGKLTINDALKDEERVRSMASIRRRRERERRQAASHDPREKVARTITLPETITIQELANRMAERAVDVIKLLMQQGVMAKMNDVIDADTAELVADELGHKVNRVTEADIEDVIKTDEDDEHLKKPRPPVVTVMGHVDHGKTSLLDALRQTEMATHEAGGITQHIGAYQIMTSDKNRVTFIDTPGHEAFTSMRARGAKVTDIVVLVVAADDGVMPQTIEAINHARAAQAPIIVAINKIDKPEADAARVKNDLLQHEIISEDMGGDTQFVEVSATQKQGLDELVEAILLQAELLELKANPDREGTGIVIEAKLDKGRGAVATILVQRGTLKVGDIFVVGEVAGRIRAMLNDKGQSVEEAAPAQPVEILGATATPNAGDIFNVVENEAKAREIADYRARVVRQARAGTGARASFDQMLKQLKEADMQEMALIVKADVQGSAEAIRQAVEKLGNEEVVARIVHTGVGGVTESDITLAAASKAPVIGFNVRANAQARRLAEEQGVEIRYYNIIYDLVNDVKAAMSGLLTPDMRETTLGNAEVLEIFDISKTGRVAGCRITDGLVRRGARVRLIRDDVVIHEGALSSLRRFKDEVKEVNAGQECGMAFENYADLKAKDMIECYEVEEIARSLDS